MDWNEVNYLEPKHNNNSNKIITTLIVIAFAIILAMLVFYLDWTLNSILVISAWVLAGILFYGYDRVIKRGIDKTTGSTSKDKKEEQSSNIKTKEEFEIETNTDTDIDKDVNLYDFDEWDDL